MSYAITPDSFKEFPSAPAPIFHAERIGAGTGRQHLTQAVADRLFPGPDRVPACRFDAQQLCPGMMGMLFGSVMTGYVGVAKGLQARTAAFLRAEALVAQLWPRARRQALSAAANSGASYYGVGSMWALPYAVDVGTGRPRRAPVLSITTNAACEIVVQVGLWGPYGLVPLRGGTDALTSNRVADAVSELCTLERVHVVLDPQGNNRYWAQRLKKDRLIPVDLLSGEDALEWVLTREQCDDWPHHRTDTAVRRILRLPRSL